MKILITLSLVLTTLALTGCTQMAKDDQLVVDSQKVFAVNEAAKRSVRHVEIIWVNPPKKRVKKQ